MQLKAIVNFSTEGNQICDNIFPLVMGLFLTKFLRSCFQIPIYNKREARVTKIL